METNAFDKMHGMFGESSTNPIMFDDIDVQVKNRIETSLKETPQNITSEEQKKKIEKLKLVCKILEQEDNPHSKDKKRKWNIDRRREKT